MLIKIDFSGNLAAPALLSFTLFINCSAAVHTAAFKACDDTLPILRPGGLTLTVSRYSLVPRATAGVRQIWAPPQNGYETFHYPENQALLKNYGTKVGNIFKKRNYSGSTRRTTHPYFLPSAFSFHPIQYVHNLHPTPADVMYIFFF